MVGRPPRSTRTDTLLPYTALFRSCDSYSAGYGGSGLAFDIDLLSELRQARDSRPLILAGGLKPETLAQLVRQVRPYAVDVSSGVESAPGIKSADKINAFMQALQASAG